MSNVPKHITIAMATYNGAKFLREQLDSIARQDYPNFDLVVSDDNSTDATIEILERYKHKINMTILINKGTKGINGNFENAIRHAKGELIAIADQDDIWQENKLSTLEANIKNNILIYSISNLIDQNGNSLNLTNQDIKKFKFTHGISAKNFYFYNSVFGHTTLFKKELLKTTLPFPPDQITYYDGWLSFAASGNIKFINKALTNYRIHTNNATHKTEEKTTKKQKTRSHAQSNYNRLEERLNIIKFVYQRGVLNQKEQQFMGMFIKATQDKLSKGFSWNFLRMVVLNFKELFHYKNSLKGFFKAISYGFMRVKR